MTTTEVGAVVMSNELVHPDAAARGMNWEWRAPFRGEHFRRCSWCGSIHPEDLAAETSWHASWADRKYGWPHKFYVEIPNRDPATLFVTAAASGPGAGDREGYILWENLSRKQRRIVRRDGFQPDKDDRWAKAFKFGTKSMHWAKFYTTHLADPQLPPAIKERIELGCGLTFTFEDGLVQWKESHV